MKSTKSKKRSKYNKIIFEESLEGYHKGYKHREHRTNKNKTGKFKKINPKKEFINEEKDDEWKEIRKQINLIGI